jgi:hypothetical protein
VTYSDACQQLFPLGRLVTLSRFLSSPDQAWGRSPCCPIDSNARKRPSVPRPTEIFTPSNGVPRPPDPKTQAELEAIAKKHGFKGFAEYDDVAANILLVMGGIDPQTNNTPTCTPR